MDLWTIAGAGTAVLLVVGLSLALGSRRRLALAIDAALRRLGTGRGRKERRDEALEGALEQVERSVAEAERQWIKLRRALDDVEVGVVVVDDEGRVAYANEPAQRFVGARHGEAVAEVRIGETLDEVLAFRRPVTRRLDLYTPVRRVLRLRATPIDDGVRSLGAVLYVEDLTERWRLDQVRRDFVANVSHELKTPLGALAVLAETLAESLDEPAVVGRLSGRIVEEARRLGRLVEELLDLSELEAMGATPEPVPVGEVVREAAARVGPAAGKASVDVIVEPVDDDLLVPGDRGQLVSAVANLLDNAVKHSPESGKVWLRVRAARERVAIEVEDHGPGIPPAHLERIFERFYRVDAGRGGDRGGTGLGLAIVKHVAVNHQGSVHVESEEGKGSRFWIDLPGLSEDG